MNTIKPNHSLQLFDKNIAKSLGTFDILEDLLELNDIEKNAANPNLENPAISFHAIKSTSMHLSFIKLSDFAKQLEQKADVLTTDEIKTACIIIIDLNQQSVICAQQQLILKESSELIEKSKKLIEEFQETEGTTIDEIDDSRLYSRKSFIIED